MSEDFNIKIKFWIEKKGISIIGPGRLAILESIHETNSLTEAAKKCNISFRKAWKLIAETNKHLDRDIIKTERGGEGGGGKTILTEYGLKLLRKYKQIQIKLNEITADKNIWDDI